MNQNGVTKDTRLTNLLPLGCPMQGADLCRQATLNKFASALNLPKLSTLSTRSSAIPNTVLQKCFGNATHQGEERKLMHTIYWTSAISAAHELVRNGGLVDKTAQYAALLFNTCQQECCVSHMHPHGVLLFRHIFIMHPSGVRSIPWLAITDFGSLCFYPP